MIFVIGDIHGAAKGLTQCLERSKFNFESDTLICLGDICDGWSETKECIDILLTIPNLILLRGNHDDWFLDWTKNRLTENEFRSWIHHGGDKTIQSLSDNCIDHESLSIYDLNYNYRGKDTIEKKYIDFLENSRLSYRLGNNYFSHAGVDFKVLENEQDLDILLWSRDLVNLAWTQKKEPYVKHRQCLEWVKSTEFWVGHTPTVRFNSYYKTPQKWANVNLIDTGAAFKGSISLVNIETKELYQSDPCYKLYPNEKGRN
jgi:serine/threonine protein phosphatase 1